MSEGRGDDENISHKIIMQQRNIIKSEDVDIYKYGLRTLRIKAVAYIIALVVAILIKYVEEFAIAFICLLSIRKYAGGYHEKTAMPKE